MRVRKYPWNFQPSPSGGSALCETIRRRTVRGVFAGTASRDKAKLDGVNGG